MNKKFTKALTMSLGLFMMGNVALQAQNVSFNGEKLSLKQAFEKLESVSDYKIAYNASQIDVTRSITLKKKNVDVLKVLDELLKGTNCTYSVNGNYIVITAVSGQKGTPRTIKGVVNVQQELLLLVLIFV